MPRWPNIGESTCVARIVVAEPTTTLPQVCYGGLFFRCPDKSTLESDSPNTSLMSNKSVLVVGSGVSGLVSAYEVRAASERKW